MSSLWQPERDPWAEVKAAAGAPQRRPQQRQRRPRPRLERFAVLVSRAGVVMMAGLLAVVILLVVILMISKV